MSRIPKPTPKASPSTPSKSQSRLPVPTHYKLPSLNGMQKPPVSPKPALKVPSNTKDSKPPVSPNRAVKPTVTRRVEDEALSPNLNASSRIKDAIALKRAEAKKAQSNKAHIEVPSSGGQLTLSGIGRGLDVEKEQQEDTLDLGRWSVLETVKRARSTGNLNLSTRSLICLPICLFEVHLDITPAPLKLVPEHSAHINGSPSRENRKSTEPAWFEAQDLHVLKARSNEIVEIQPELSLFGSLKLIDLHNNRIESLPTSFVALASLTSLDISSNKLAHLHPSLFSLPSLTILNISHNELTSLPFSQFGSPIDRSDLPSAGGFFVPEVKRADSPLPKLHTLNAEHNKLTSLSIDFLHIPGNIAHLRLSRNPLGSSQDLLSALARSDKLKELYLEGADLEDDVLGCTPTKTFPQVQLLDFGDTKVTAQAVRSFFAGSPREAQLSFDVTTSNPKVGELRVIVGKKVVKEAWEVEAEQRLRKRRGVTSTADGQAASPGMPQKVMEKIPVDQKEAWEIEAEQGLLTEGGRRRARAAEVAKATSSRLPSLTAPLPSASNQAEDVFSTYQRQKLPYSGPLSIASSATLSNPTYYSSSTLTLTLPPTQPRMHARAFSLAASPQKGKAVHEDLTLPSPTLPLNVIVKEDFASTLRILILSGRRADPTFHLPSASFLSTASGSTLPNLDELDLEGCMLGDTVPVCNASSDGGSPVMRKENTIELVAKLFPSLRVLNLSGNALTSTSLTSEILSALVAPSHPHAEKSSLTVKHKGLRALRLRENRISDLEGFEKTVELLKENSQLNRWSLEELDVRDNDIARLPAIMGLLPLDVFLVDGNTFRVPARKVWEREGTKGLLNWLKNRME